MKNTSTIKITLLSVEIKDEKSENDDDGDRPDPQWDMHI